MNVLFLTIGSMLHIQDRGIYTDLLRRFRDEGHSVYAVSAYQKRMGKPTVLEEDHGVQMLHVRIGNITSCGLLEKGVSTLKIEGQYLAAIKQYFPNVKFDLVMYSTPPITFARVVEYIRRRDGAASYLLLKDIFPQNAVDLGMMSGIKAPLLPFFRAKEKRLYAQSDKIGCMSKANVNYLLAHNPQIAPERVEVCPNSFEVVYSQLDSSERSAIREKYGVPMDKTVFIYGGNLGRPQGLPQLLRCLDGLKDHPRAYFLIVGGGTEAHLLEEYLRESQAKNLRYIPTLPKDDFERLTAACDAGMIFLDHRFTIPNFPSRLLSYMQAKLPVLCATDPNTDVGDVAADNGFGWKCKSDDPAAFAACVERALEADLPRMGEKAFLYLKENYDVRQSYATIMKGIKK